MAAGAQENKKLQELELLMDVQRVIAATDAQRKSLEDMGIDVEKGLTGNGGLVGAVSPVLLLSKPYWMKRISAVLTERMHAELQRGEVARREHEGERCTQADNPAHARRLKRWQTKFGRGGYSNVLEL